MVHFTDICVTRPQWVEETAELSVIWDTIRLMWRHCNISWKKDGNHALRIHCIYRATINLHNAILQYCPNLLNSGFFKSYLDIFTISLHNTTGRHFTAVVENISNPCKKKHQHLHPPVTWSINALQHNKNSVQVRGPSIYNWISQSPSQHQQMIPHPLLTVLQVEG